jgi:cytochrome b
MKKNKEKRDGNRIRIWDIPTRVFHWSLVALVSASFITGKLSAVWMPYHEVFGIIILGMLVFRLIWGVIGGYHSQFISFVRGPEKVFQYAAGLFSKNGSSYPGHNPLGGWSVLAMLGVLLIQVVTGLFSNDDIFTEGPLYPFVDKVVSDLLTSIHRFNSYVIMGLVAVHVCAILFYLIVKRENLIHPMITGYKPWMGDSEPSREKPWAAIISTCIAAFCFYILYFKL